MFFNILQFESERCQKLRDIFKPYFHWRRLVRLRQRLMTVRTGLGHLGQRKSDRIISIFCCATQGGQGKYNSDCRLSLFQAFRLKNIDNGTEPLSRLSVLMNEKERIEKTKSFK
jgi:hypothetical protein